MSHNTGEDKTGGEKGIRVSVRNTAREAKDRNVRCKLNEIGKRSITAERICYPDQIDENKQVIRVIQ